jgi:hypothetical protein
MQLVVNCAPDAFDLATAQVNPRFEKSKSIQVGVIITDSPSLLCQCLPKLELCRAELPTDQGGTKMNTLSCIVKM